MLEQGRVYFELIGDSIGLMRLAATFTEKPIRVFLEDNEYLLNADEIQGPEQRYPKAERVLRTLKGTMRASQANCDGVKLGAQIEIAPEGHKIVSVMAHASINMGAAIVLGPTVYRDGVAQPNPRPLAVRIKEFVDSGNEYAVSLQAMMEKGEPDWRDLYVIAEILERTGYVKRRGLKKQVDEVMWTAGNWAAVGSEARHAIRDTNRPRTLPQNLSPKS